MKAFGVFIALALVVGAAAFAAWYFFVRVPTPATTEEKKQPPYVFDDAGIRFEYPRTYTFESYPLEDESTSWNSLMLVRTKEKLEAEANGASEGPVAITIGIFPNDANLSAEAWVRGDPHSNYALSNNQPLKPITVGGESAVSYTHSGLYESDAVVAAYGRFIYLFEVGWMDANDSIRADFQNLLKSVQFK